MIEQQKEDHLVLRTVYISKNVDDKLRKLAFQMDRSKNELIREGIDLLLKKLDKHS